jgi:hypothetical protein
MILKEEILKAQERWGQGIVQIGKDELAASLFVNTMYSKDALFKPTMAKELPFRLEVDQAVSYFVGGSVKEDKGFAKKPWIAVRFENAKINLFSDYAIAMGHYYFSDVNNEETRVEYSFSYLKDQQGNIKISLHHSSLP